MTERQAARRLVGAAPLAETSALLVRAALLARCRLCFRGVLRDPFTRDGELRHRVLDEDRRGGVAHLVERRRIQVAQRVAGLVVARVVGFACDTAVHGRLLGGLDPLGPVNRPPAGMPASMKGP